MIHRKSRKMISKYIFDRMFVEYLRVNKFMSIFQCLTYRIFLVEKDFAVSVQRRTFSGVPCRMFCIRADRKSPGGFSVGTILALF